jgi:hypothetical protein
MTEQIPEMMMITYRESKLPKVRQIARSWPQINVYAAPNIIIALGDPHIIDVMITDVRMHAQRHKQDISTTALSYQDWLVTRRQENTVHFQSSKEQEPTK